MLARDAAGLCRPDRAWEVCGDRLPGPSLVGLAPAQAITSQACGPEQEKWAAEMPQGWFLVNKNQFLWLASAAGPSDTAAPRKMRTAVKILLHDEVLCLFSQLARVPCVRMLVKAEKRTLNT